MTSGMDVAEVQRERGGVPYSGSVGNSWTSGVEDVEGRGSSNTDSLAAK